MARISSLFFALFIMIQARALPGADHPSVIQEPDSTAVSADFDGDSKPDVTIGSRAGLLGYTLEVHFSSELPSAFLSLANAGSIVKVVICDVNRDSDPDLVIQGTASVFPLAVWLGDGRGHFRQGIPWNYLPSRMNFGSRAISDQSTREQASLLPKKRLGADALPALPLNLTLVNRQLGTGSQQLPILLTYYRRNLSRSPPSLL